MRVANGGALAQGAAFEVAARQIRAERDRGVDLVVGEAHDLRGGDRGAEDAEHRSGVEPARHDRRNPVGGHPLHHLVAGRDAGDEVPARRAFHFRGNQRGRDDRRPGMREHPEGVPLAARQHHFRVREGGASPGHPASVHQDGGAASHALFFAGDERHRLLARGQLRSDERRREVLERQSLDAIDNRGGKILVAQTDDPLRELAAERLAGGGACCGGLSAAVRRRRPTMERCGPAAPGRETRTEKAPAIDVHAAPRFLLSGLTFRERSSLQRVG